MFLFWDAESFPMGSLFPFKRKHCRVAHSALQRQWIHSSVADGFYFILVSKWPQCCIQVIEIASVPSSNCLFMRWAKRDRWWQRSLNGWKYRKRDGQEMQERDSLPGSGKVDWMARVAVMQKFLSSELGRPHVVKPRGLWSFGVPSCMTWTTGPLCIHFMLEQSLPAGICSQPPAAEQGEDSCWKGSRDPLPWAVRVCSGGAKKVNNLKGMGRRARIDVTENEWASGLCT